MKIRAQVLRFGSQKVLAAMSTLPEHLVGKTLEIELPDPPKPEVKTPGQIVYEAKATAGLASSFSWGHLSTTAKNKFHNMAHKLGIGGDKLYLEPEAKPEPVTPGEAAHAAYRRNYPGLSTWTAISSNDRLAWECAAQDAITVGRGDRVTR